MKLLSILCCAFVGCLASVAAQRSASPEIPHLRKQGQPPNLIVDGKPFLVLAGRVDQQQRQPASSTMKPIWSSSSRPNS